MSNAPAWECQYSIDVDVPAPFAWQYMTDVGNWSDPPAEFTLDGPFTSGAQGTTRMPGQPPAAWTVRDVDDGRAYTIEGGSFLENARLLFCWRFDPISNDCSRLTQRVELCGENAAAYIEGVRDGLGPNLEPGMLRIARLMTTAWRRGGRGRQDG
jgi:hypothetical protein